MFDLAHFHKIVRNRVVWIVFLVLIIASFVFTYTPNTNQGDLVPRSKTVIGTVDGREIGPEEYDLASFHTGKARGAPRDGDETDDQYRRRVLTRIAMLDQARAAGVRVSVDEVMEVVGSAPIFRDESGSFQVERFLVWLQQYKWPSEEAFFSFLVSENTISRLRDLQARGGLLVSPADLRDAYERDFEQFDLSYVKVDRSAAGTNEIAVTDAMIETYYKENQEEYRQAEEARVAYLTVTVDDAFATNRVTDAEILAYYTANLTNEFTKTVTSTNAASTNLVMETAQVPLEQARTGILMKLAFPKAQEKMRETAYTIFDMALPRRGFQHQTFEEINKGLGAPLATSAWFTASQPIPGLDLGPEATKAVFSLGTNLADRIAEPLVSSNKAFVVQLVDRRPARVRDLAEVRDIVRFRALQKARNDALIEAAKAKRDAIAAALKAGQSFTNAVASVQLTGTNKVTFSRGGGELRAVPGLFQIVNDLDTAKPGDLLGPVAAADGAYIALLNAVKPADPAGFEAVKENFANSFKRRRMEALAKDFEALAEKKVKVEPRKEAAAGT